jgi:hypothetical protein
VKKGFAVAAILLAVVIPYSHRIPSTGGTAVAEIASAGQIEKGAGVGAGSTLVSEPVPLRGVPVHRCEMDVVATGTLLALQMYKVATTLQSITVTLSNTLMSIVLILKARAWAMA